MLEDTETFFANIQGDKVSHGVFMLCFMNLFGMLYWLLFLTFLVDMYKTQKKINSVLMKLCIVCGIYKVRKTLNQHLI